MNFGVIIFNTEWSIYPGIHVHCVVRKIYVSEFQFEGRYEYQKVYMSISIQKKHEIGQ